MKQSPNKLKVNTIHYWLLLVFLGSVSNFLMLSPAFSAGNSGGGTLKKQDLPLNKNSKKTDLYQPVSQEKCLLEDDSENPRPVIGNMQVNAELIQEVQDTAQKITVRIEWWSNDRSQVLDYGSGVIIAKDNGTYYVMTNEHVVRHEGIYRLVTSDGKQYKVDYSLIKKAKAIDLAVLQFRSKRDYEVATLANFGADSRNLFFRNHPLNPGQSIFVTGWTSNKDNSPRNSWIFHWGVLKPHHLRLFTANDYKSLVRGYELTYTAPTHSGMSGGAILDPDGRVIGIHGHSEGGNLVEDTTDVVSIYRGYSMGVPIKKLLKLAPQLGLSCEWLMVENSPPRAVVVLDPAWLNPAYQSAPPFEWYSFIEDPEWGIRTDSPDENLASTWINRGNLYWRLGRDIDANTAFNQAIKIKSDASDAWYGLALSANDARSGLEILDELIQISPDFHQAFRLKGFIYLTGEEYLKALDAFNRVIELRASSQERSEDAQLHFFKGHSLYMLGQYNQALDELNLALSIDPYALCYCMRGDVYSKLGDLDKAIEDYTRMITLMPESPTGYIARGKAHYELGDFESSISDYSKALDDISISSNLIYKPREWAEVYSLRGDAYSSTKDYPRAIEDYNKALSKDSTLIQAYWGRGKAYFFNPRFDKAIEDFSQVIARDPSFAPAYAFRGVALVNLRGLAAGTSDIQKALALYRTQGDIESYQGLLSLLEEYNINLD